MTARPALVAFALLMIAACDQSHDVPSSAPAQPAL